jgi:hypothetical protein
MPRGFGAAQRPVVGTQSSSVNNVDGGIIRAREEAYCLLAVITFPAMNRLRDRTLTSASNLEVSKSQLQLITYEYVKESPFLQFTPLLCTVTCVDLSYCTAAVLETHVHRNSEPRTVRCTKRVSTRGCSATPKYFFWCGSVQYA